MLIVLIGPPRPEEAAEPIAFAAGDDVHVQVRHALTDAVVHCDEGTVGAHSFLDRMRHQLHLLE